MAEVRRFDKAIAVAQWLERSGCRGAEAEHVRELLADRIEGDEIVLPRIAVKGLKGR